MKTYMTEEDLGLLRGTRGHVSQGPGGFKLVVGFRILKKHSDQRRDGSSLDDGIDGGVAF